MREIPYIVKIKDKKGKIKTEIRFIKLLDENSENIKKALEFNKDKKLFYGENNIYKFIDFSDILHLIKKLEKEIELLKSCLNCK